MKSKIILTVLILLLACLDSFSFNHEIEFIEAKGFDTIFYFDTNMPNAKVEVRLIDYKGSLGIQKDIGMKGVFYVEANGKLKVDTYKIDNGKRRASSGWIPTSKQFTIAIEAFPEGEKVESKFVFQQHKRGKFSLK